MGNSRCLEQKVRDGGIRDEDGKMNWDQEIGQGLYRQGKGSEFILS